MIVAFGGGTITFDSTLNGAENTGTIKASAGGTIIIDGFEGGNGLSNSDGTVEAIGTGAKVELAGATIISGTLETSGGGIIEAVSGTSTLLNVTFDGGVLQVDTGAIADLSGGMSGLALVVDGTVTFQGGGAVELDFSSYEIVAGAGGGTLDNATTIEGTGQIGAGDGKLSLDNQSGGIVDADINGATLTIHTGNTVTNAGTLESSNSGTLDIKDNVDNTALIEAGFGSFVNFESNGAGSITNDGGTIKADAGEIDIKLSITSLTNENGGVIEAVDGGVVQIEARTVHNSGGTIEAIGTDSTMEIGGSDIIDGTLKTSDGGIIDIIASFTTFDGLTIATGSDVKVGAGVVVVLADTVENDGNIEVVDNHAGLRVNAAATFTGTGTVTLDGPTATIMGAGLGTFTLHNDSTIQGAGTIGGQGLVLDNQSNGVVDANLTDGTLIIDTGNILTNAGTLEATNGGTLQIDDSVANESTGVILATGTGSTVSITFNGGGVNNDGMEKAVAGGTLNLTDDSGGVGNNSDGTIKADAGTVSVTGGIDNNGTVEAVDGGTLTINIDYINNNSGGVGNFGTIEADGGTVSIIATVSDAIVLNAGNGTIEALDCGIVSLEAVTVDNSGMIEADGLHAVINLEAVTINGGTLATTGGGIIETVADSGTSTLSGVAIDDGSVLKADTGSSLDLEGTTTINGTVTFEGGGTFVLDDPPDVASIVGGSGGGTLDIAAGAMLNGSGTIGNAGATALALSNSGTVDADGAGAEIDIETANYTTTNTGLLEATKGGTLAIESDVNNDCGTIGASGAGSTVQLVGAINIAGGTLTTGNRLSASGGMIEIVAVAAVETILDGSAHAVTIDGYVQVDAGASLALDGTIDNDGTIDLASDSGPSTNLVIQTDVTLQGGGQVTLTDGGESAIVTNGSAVTLTNVDNTISGVGTIGDRQYLTLVNEHDGTIDANISGSTLTIDTSNTVTNAGTLEATNGGILQIDDVVDNSGNVGTLDGHVQIDGDVTNEGTGQIGAGNSGTLTFGAVTVTNDAGGDIGAFAGGQVTFDHSHVENHGHIGPNGGTVTFDCSVVCNDSAPTKDGNGGITADGGGTIKFTYSCVTNDGEIGALDCSSITFCNSHVVNTAGTSSDGNGIVALDGGSVTFTDSCIDNTGFIRALIGSGDDGSAGTIYFTDSTVNNAGGTISAIGNGSVVQLADTTINGGTLATDLCGLIEVVASDDGDSVLDGSANAVTVQGVVQVEKGAALDLAGTIIDNGTIEIVSGDPDLVIVGCVTLDSNGSGTVKLDGSGADIVGANGGADTLKNSITIEGAGTIGNAELSVTNECSGIIDATGCLTINLGSNELTNQGLLEATGGGELMLLSTVSNSNTIAAYAGSTVNLDGFIGNSDCGQVIASGHCAVVDLLNATINGGTVESDSGGLIQTVAGSDNAATQSIFDGVTIGCGSDLKVVDQTTLVLEGGTTMSGGRLSIESSGDVEIVNGGGSGGATLTDVNLHNCGEVTVDGNTTLTLSGTTVHGGTIDGTDASGCVIASTIDVTGDSTFCDVNLSGGDLTVEGNVTLTLSGVTVDGTTIDDYTDSGSFVIPGTIHVTGDSAINNSTVEGEGGPADGGTPGAIAVDCNVTLTLDDTTLEDLNVTNNGTLQVDGTHTLTLDDVSVTDNGTIVVGDVASGAILTLDDGTAITGNGVGTLTINFGNTLDVEKGANDGNNGATLDGVIVQDNGAIDIGDVATGAILTLDDGTKITGGGTAALKINAGSTLDVENGPNGGGATLDDVHVTDNGALNIDDVASGDPDAPGRRDDHRRRHRHDDHPGPQHGRR